MLSPEVACFPAPISWRKYKSGLLVNDYLKTTEFKQNNEVVKNVKLFVPECLHPPDELRKIVLRDKECYKVEKLTSLECVATKDFVTTFISQGKLFIQTVDGKVWGDIPMSAKDTKVVL